MRLVKECIEGKRFAIVRPIFVIAIMFFLSWPFVGAALQATSGTEAYRVVGWRIYVLFLLALLANSIWIWNLRGIADLAPLISILDQLFSEKIKVAEGNRVTFEDVRKQNGLGLIQSEVTFIARAATFFALSIRETSRRWLEHWIGECLQEPILYPLRIQTKYRSTRSGWCCLRPCKPTPPG